MTAHISTYWHAHYISAARTAYPDICAQHSLAVGWKITRKDGITTNGYYWPLVNGEYDVPVLHLADRWDNRHHDACPARDGDGLCLVTTSAAGASSGGIELTEGVGHVLVFPARLARSNVPGKRRVPWCIDVDAFNPVELIRLGLADVRLVDARLPGANFTDARLTSANFAGAVLAGANFTGARLTGANFTDARLTGANFAGARLTGANFADARLTGANFAGAMASHQTVWPAGFKPARAGIIAQ